MSEINRQIEMITEIANGLGEELLGNMAFVGGCTTGLLVTDEFTKEVIRYTDDVDLIVHIVGYVGWPKLQDKLRALGFKDDIDPDSPLCRMKLGEIKVDFMPDDEKVLGFTNIWYQDALSSAEWFEVHDGVQIKLVNSVYFVATKLEAYKGRGNSDPLSSHDIEDLINIFDGRTEIVDEILSASEAVQSYIASELTDLLRLSDFENAIQSAALGNRDREDLIYERLEMITEHAK